LPFLKLISLVKRQISFAGDSFKVFEIRGKVHAV